MSRTRPGGSAGAWVGVEDVLGGFFKIVSMVDAIFRTHCVLCLVVIQGIRASREAVLVW